MNVANYTFNWKRRLNDVLGGDDGGDGDDVEVGVTSNKESNVLPKCKCSADGFQRRQFEARPLERLRESRL